MPFSKRLTWWPKMLRTGLLRAIRQGGALTSTTAELSSSKVEICRVLCCLPDGLGYAYTSITESHTDALPASHERRDAG